MEKNNKKLGDRMISLVVKGAALFTFSILVFIICFIIIKGVPHLKPSLFAFKYTSENVSLLPSLITTIIMTVISLLIATPLGIMTAIYLVEYAEKGNRVVKIIRLTSETLSGIPSIIYGMFGLLFFVTYLGWGYSILAGSFILSIMILPTIMRTTEEALSSIPDSYREGSFGLGAGKLRTILQIVLPSAIPGILTGVILSVGRIVGETAALIYTSGTVAKIPESVFESGRTLALHMYALSSEGFNTDEAYATAVVLLILVFGINTLSSVIAKRLTRS